MKIKVKASNNTIELRESEKINELQKEVNYLKELLNLKRNGNPDDVHRQLYILKKENYKLKKIALSNNPNLSKHMLPGTPSNYSLISTARGHRKDLTEGKKTNRNSMPLLQSNKEIKPNNRYSDSQLNMDTPTGINPNMNNYDINKPMKTRTTGLTSNVQGTLSREGRSSTDLQFAGAKILAGTYSRKPARNGSMGREDEIPVRIRSHKKMGKSYPGECIV